jgi:predicted AAA+ superfamily ATPase
MIKRERYMRQIRPFINTDLIKVLTGLRRCGKSVMLSLIQAEQLAQKVPPQNLISLNFEDLDSVALRDSEKLHRYLLDKIKPLHGRAYVFLDEIQEVPAWEKCVNSLRVKCDADIYVTGSNANLLSGEFATVLGGRYVAFTIYPFCFSEFLDALKQYDPGINAYAAFSRYLTLGGMPFLSNLQSSKDAAQQYLRDIYDSVVLKDVVSRYSIRDVDLKHYTRDGAQLHQSLPECLLLLQNSQTGPAGGQADPECGGKVLSGRSRDPRGALWQKHARY